MKIRKFNINKNLDGLTETVSSIESILDANKTTSKKKGMATLLTEESIVKLAEAADEGSIITVCVRSNYRKTYISIASKGKEVDFTNLLSGADPTIDENVDFETAEAISNIILKANSKDISYSYTKGISHLNILVYKNDNLPVIDVLTSIVLALVLGFVIRFACPEAVKTFLSTDILSPMYKIFLNLMKMVMAPLVFFSLANSIGGFNNIKALGRSGAKVFSMYLLTTAFAISISFGVFSWLHTEIQVPMVFDGGGNSVAEIADVSLLDTVMNLIPATIVSPFLYSDMLQIIVLALIIGLSIAALGEHASMLKKAFEALDALFSKITQFIVKLLPLAVFGSIANMVVTTDISGLSALSSWILMIILSFIGILLTYMLLLLTLARVNPLRFLRNYSKAILTSMTTCSSAATMPNSMMCCEKMGVSPFIYKFSIPLGATVNMDGTSIFLVISTFFLANVCGITIPASMMATLIVTVLLLSVAAPGVPGAALACLSMLLSIANIPLESVSLIIGAYTILDGCLTTSNILGDGVVTTIVANSENLLDRERFNSSVVPVGHDPTTP